MQNLDPKFWEGRLFPDPNKPELDFALLSPVEKYLVETAHETHRLLTRLLEIVTRYQLQEDLLTASPKHFQDLLDEAVKKKNFVLLQIARKAASIRGDQELIDRTAGAIALAES